MYVHVADSLIPLRMLSHLWLMFWMVILTIHTKVEGKIVFCEVLNMYIIYYYTCISYSVQMW